MDQHHHQYPNQNHQYPNQMGNNQYPNQMGNNQYPNQGYQQNVQPPTQVIYQTTVPQK